MDELASKGGHLKATMDLAEMYWKGEGVGVDRSEAYYLFFLARRRGLQDASARAQKLWQEMSSDDIKHLEKKLRDLRYDPQKVIAGMRDQAVSDASQESTHP